MKINALIIAGLVIILRGTSEASYTNLPGPITRPLSVASNTMSIVAPSNAAAFRLANAIPSTNDTASLQAQIDAFSTNGIDYALARIGTNEVDISVLETGRWSKVDGLATAGVLQAALDVVETGKYSAVSGGVQATGKWDKASGLATAAVFRTAIDLVETNMSLARVLTNGNNAAGLSVTNLATVGTDNLTVNDAFIDTIDPPAGGTSTVVNTELSFSAGKGMTLDGDRRTTWPSSLTRYEACDVADEEVWVLATGTGITATRVGASFLFSIPAGVHLASARIRWPGTYGTTLTLDMGTTDMANSSLLNRWGCTCAVYREDTGAAIATAAAKLVVGTHDQIQVQGLHDTQFNHIVLGF
jgi:hypothetical protein